MSRIYPSVLRLQVHLPYQQTVAFSRDANLENIINDDKNERTMLTEYFRMNETDVDARNYLYREFPRYYIWNKTNKKWTKRHHGNMIGRMYMVNPNEGEKYYLRLLLNHVKGATSFTDLKNVRDYVCTTFRESALMRGIIEVENPYHNAM
ncbi:3826_t:CDS:1 [Cetraspora pellucida]|uniref:3826_t:CDS:1 n=1 Tax=Cetraspora pellucida TaxID=1433469 RepID=A0ACA9MIL1_9GLOM|nr:3826_t:CDS:1 [Cetraspora pellucida]